MTTRRRSRVFEGRAVPTAIPERPQQIATAKVVPPEVRKQADAQQRRVRRQQQKNRDRNERRRARAAPNHVVVPQRDHAGKTFVLFASGPSLTQEVVEQVRPFVEEGLVIAAGLNDTYRIVPYLQEFYACDQHWWKFHLANPQDGKHVLDSQPDCRIWGNQTAAPTLNQHDRICVLKGNGGAGFSEKPELIHWGGNSGYQLLNLCYHLGGPESTFLLCGYNMQVPNKMGKKGHHFFGPHQKPMSQAGSYRGFVKQFHTIQGHIKKQVINCTPDTALDCFTKSELTVELDKIWLGREYERSAGEGLSGPRDL